MPKMLSFLGTLKSDDFLVYLLEKRELKRLLKAQLEKLLLTMNKHLCLCYHDFVKLIYYLSFFFFDEH